VHPVDDEKVVSQLASLAIKSKDKDLRQQALRLLKEAFIATDRRKTKLRFLSPCSLMIDVYHAFPVSHLSRPIKASLQEVIEHSLKDRKLRANALDVIDDLTSDHGIGVYRIVSLARK
jgi:hypothetical protein